MSAPATTPVARNVAPNVPVHAPSRATIALLGASGYSGQEFVRLALAHPGLTLGALVSREPAASASDLLPGIDPRRAAAIPVVTPGELPALLRDGRVDTLVACLPHGAWDALATDMPDLASEPARIVDLSADRRDGDSGYVYGLPEAFRAEISAAARIANPGCYPTATTLALLPPAEAGLLEGPITVSALSGVSGAGRAAALRTSFVELAGGASVYKAGTQHNHVAEMERNLRRLAGRTLPLGFIPHLVPMARGIIATVTAPLARPITTADMRDLYSARYASEPFVRLLPDGSFPETRAVSGSNRCDVAVMTLHDGRQLLAMAAIDNLVKGAAGQAVQNLNIGLGWPETTGLSTDGRPW